MIKQFYFTLVSFLFAFSLNVKVHSSFRRIDRDLLGATTLVESIHRNDGSVGVIRIPKSYGITRASPSLSYLGHLLGGAFSFPEMQLVYSVALTDQTKWYIYIYI